MVVAGGDWQVPLIQYLKNAGHTVINTNLYENSPGFKYADKCFVLNVLDKQNTLKVAKECCIDAVVTDQSDIAVPTVAYVAQALGLRGITVDIAELFTNKYKMRTFCKEYGYPTPSFTIAKTEQQVYDFIKKNGYPIVLKPKDSQSSRGVNIVFSETNLPFLIADTLNACQDGSFIVESYIDGYELTVEGYKTKDKHTTLAISEKSFMPGMRQIATSLFYSINALEKHKILIAKHDQMIEKMGLPFGITHTEYKYCKGTYYLIETAARGGGTKISSHIIHAISGVDIYKNLLNDILGLPQIPILKNKSQRSVVLDFFQFQHGKVRLINGKEEVLMHPNVIDFSINFEEGGWVPSLKDDRSRSGYIIIQADGDDELISLTAKLKGLIRVEYE